MKELLHLVYQASTEVEYATIRRIREICGESIDPNRRTRGLDVKVLSGSDAHRMFEEMVERVRPAPTPSVSAAYCGSSYFVVASREWEPHEIEAAEFVVVEAELVWNGRSAWSRDGIDLEIAHIDAFEIGVEDLIEPVLGYGTRGVTVNSEVRAACERLSCVGAQWIRIEAVDDEKDDEILPWPEGSQRFWGLFSSVELPPVSPSMIRSPGVDTNSLCSMRNCNVRDSDRYGDVQLHYRRSDLAPFMHVDLAHTLEGGEGFAGQHLVISQRVCRLFRSMNLRLRYVPVVIEE